MAAPAGEEAWKELVRGQAAKAAGCCARAHGLLADAHRQLTDAIEDLEHTEFTDDPGAWRVWARRADVKLADALGDLDAAASLMAAARLIALRGGAASPDPPLSSAGDLPGDALRSAFSLLGRAKDRAEHACDVIGLCRVHLAGVGRLLAHPLLPGLKGLVNFKLVFARDELERAQEFEEQSNSLVDDALLQLLLI